MTATNLFHIKSIRFGVEDIVIPATSTADLGKILSADSSIDLDNRILSGVQFTELVLPPTTNLQLDRTSLLRLTLTQGNQAPGVVTKRVNLSQSSAEALIITAKHLYQCDFRRSRFDRTTCENTVLEKCEFMSASLGKAYFSKTILGLCNFRKADLGASSLFADCTLNRCDFSSVTVRGVERRVFANCTFDNCNFLGAEIATQFEQTFSYRSEKAEWTVLRVLQSTYEPWAYVLHVSARKLPKAFTPPSGLVVEEISDPVNFTIPADKSIVDPIEHISPHTQLDLDKHFDRETCAALMQTLRNLLSRPCKL